MMKFTAICLSVALAGCGVFTPREGEMSLNDKILLIEKTTESVTVLALHQAFDETELVAKATMIAELVDNNILQVLNEDSELTEVLQDELFALNIDSEYKSLLAAAIGIFELYYETPTAGEVIGSERLQLLRAFCQGVVNGALLVVELNQGDSA